MLTLMPLAIVHIFRIYLMTQNMPANNDNENKEKIFTDHNKHSKDKITKQIRGPN